MTPCNDAVEKLTTFAELHHQMHGVVIFICGLEFDDVRVLW
jgi:hypothetical protein